MAVVQVNSNTLDFIFDSEINYYELHNFHGLLELNENTEIYYYNENNTLVNLNYVYPDTNSILGFGATEIDGMYFVAFNTTGVSFIKYKDAINDDDIKVEKNQWYVVIGDFNLIKTKGFRIENFAYAEGQTLETINTLVNPYIGTKTSFAKTYTLRVNGKTLNTINGKKIRNLIYNGTTYEIAEPVASGHTLTLDYSNIDNNSSLTLSIKYTTNTGETGSYFSGIGTMTLNNVESITFEGTLDDDSFIPYLTSCKVGSTKGGSEYGMVGVYAGDTPLTLNITEDKTIYLYGTYAKPAPDLPF